MRNGGLPWLPLLSQQVQHPSLEQVEVGVAQPCREGHVWVATQQGERYAHILLHVSPRRKVDQLGGPGHAHYILLCGGGGAAQCEGVRVGRCEGGHLRLPATASWWRPW